MPIHFSIGFVVEQMPRRQFMTICATAVKSDIIAATAYEADVVDSVLCDELVIRPNWERRGAQCR